MPPFMMVLFRLALQVSIAGDCAFAGQRCHFAGEDLGQLQVSQFAGDCVHLQGGRCSTYPEIVASRGRLGNPSGGGPQPRGKRSPGGWRTPSMPSGKNFEPVATLKILPSSPGIRGFGDLALM